MLIVFASRYVVLDIVLYRFPSLFAVDTVRQFGSWICCKIVHFGQENCHLSPFLRKWVSKFANNEGFLYTKNRYNNAESSSWNNFNFTMKNLYLQNNKIFIYKVYKVYKIIFFMLYIYVFRCQFFCHWCECLRWGFNYLMSNKVWRWSFERCVKSYGVVWRLFLW